MNSIKRRLMLSVTVAFILGWVVLSLYIYTEAKHEVGELYDAELVTFAELLTHVPADLDLEQGVGHIDLLRKGSQHRYVNKISVQHWLGERLLYHSENTPERRLTNKNGFTDILLYDEPWRYYQTTKSDGSILVIGEQREVRYELIHNIAMNTLAPMIWTLPVLLIILNFAITRGLRPLKRLSRRVSDMDQKNLYPLSTRDTPTEVLPLTQALNGLLIRLQEALEKETRFTADVSHELRTPLAGVRSQAQLARRFATEPRTIGAIDKALTGLDRCDRLVSQMLTLQRLNPEQAGEQFTNTDLLALTEGVCNDLRQRAEEKSINLLTEFPETYDGVMIIGYAPGLYVLLKNVIENAINYTPACGQVSVTIDLDTQEHITLDVTDTGPGIPEEIKDQVFNRFYRERDRGVPGVGLGLAIVKQIADLHQINLKLENQANPTGLKFRILFKKTP